MPGRENTELEAVPELEAIAAAAAARLRAQSSAEPHDADALDEAVGRAATCSAASNAPPRANATP